MSERAYYIYALKDPRTSPAKPFYIGKGTGTRAWDHLVTIDETKKGKRIKEINADDREVLVTVLADDLAEHQALKLEAELITVFGVEEQGGLLTNVVVPSGSPIKGKASLIIPSGTVEKAQLGLQFLLDAIMETAKANPGGVTNSELSKGLGLQSDYAGGSKDYLTWSLLGLLMRTGKIKRQESGRKHIAQVK